MRIDIHRVKEDLKFGITSRHYYIVRYRNASNGKRRNALSYELVERHRIILLLTTAYFQNIAHALFQLSYIFQLRLLTNSNQAGYPYLCTSLTPGPVVNQRLQGYFTSSIPSSTSRMNPKNSFCHQQKRAFVIDPLQGSPDAHCPPLFSP